MIALYCDINCFEFAICDFCRFCVRENWFCTRDNKGIDPIDVCTNFECKVAYEGGGK